MEKTKKDLLASGFISFQSHPVGLLAGIWGSIWLEGVPATSYIVDVEAFTDLDSGTAKFTVATSSMQQIGQTHFMFSLNNQTLGPMTNVSAALGHSVGLPAFDSLPEVL